MNGDHELRCLDEWIKDNADERPIYLINYSMYYLTELCDTFPVLKRIAGGWDDVTHRQGKHDFRGCKITIWGYDDSCSIPKEAVLLILDSYPQARFQWLQKKQHFLQQFSACYYFAGREMDLDLSYRKKYSNTPLKNVIVFRSGDGASRRLPGEDFGDNARALFEYMLAKNYDRKYELVWFVHDPEAYAGKYAGRRVRFLPYKAALTDDVKLRDAYYEALCLAKFIFFTNSAVFCRNAREDQVRVQLWHGCGLKSVRNTHVGTDEYKYEYMTVVSRLYADMHVEEFGLRREQLLVTGYPKDDLLYHPLEDWQERLQVPRADKYIFWLPTWRTTELQGEWQGKVLNAATGLPIVSSAEMLMKLNALLQKLNSVLIIKLHPRQDRNSLSAIECSQILVLENETLAGEDVQINEILGHADALISDYSSAAVDYALLDRPIAFTVDDKEEYAGSHGFLWDDIHQWLPGVELARFSDMVAFVQDVAAGRDFSREKRRRLNEQFHDFDDDNNSARVLAALGITL